VTLRNTNKIVTSVLFQVRLTRCNTTEWDSQTTRVKRGLNISPLVLKFFQTRFLKNFLRWHVRTGKVAGGVTNVTRFPQLRMWIVLLLVRFMKSSEITSCSQSSKKLSKQHCAEL